MITRASVQELSKLKVESFLSISVKGYYSKLLFVMEI